MTMNVLSWCTTFQEIETNDGCQKIQLENIKEKFRNLWSLSEGAARTHSEHSGEMKNALVYGSASVPGFLSSVLGWEDGVDRRRRRRF